MSRSDWKKIELIVDEILDRDPDEWHSYLKIRCANEPQEITTGVTQLIESIQKSEGWLQHPEEYKNDLLADVFRDEFSATLKGERFGSYVAKELIAEGGMGAVYLGERAEGDFDHTVAIKVIKAGMSTPENIRRFNRERRILAGLKHDGIAQLYGGGISENNLPYLIMEYVEGIRIDEYCNKHNLTLLQRTDLFKKVLSAIRYAHENLVIHRDLKPGNILVTSAGDVKILDFGIARLLDNEAGDEPIQNVTQSRILTPKYAAPEQILQAPVTTASDIYALGIIFYNLLSGAHPFETDGLSPFEIEQIILKSNFSKPSSRVQSNNQKKILRGDLDAIVLKSCRKMPENRYRSVNEFLDDLERFQKNEPVSAIEAGLPYRATKFLKRYSRWAAAAALALLFIALFFGFYTYRITQERNLAQQQLNKAEQISDFLISVFNSNDPVENSGNEITAYQLLQHGLEEIEELNDDQLRAEMYLVMGEAYQSLGYADIAGEVMDKGVTAQRKMYGENSLEYAAALLKRGILEQEFQNADKALPYLREAYHIRSNKLPESDYSVIYAKSRLAHSLKNTGEADSAGTMMYEIIENIDTDYYKETETRRGRLRQLYSFMADVLRDQGNLEEASKYYLEVIYLLDMDKKENDHEAASYYNNLAFVHRDMEEFKEAEKYLKKSLIINEQIRGEGHPTTVLVRSNLAGIMLRQQNLDAALNLQLQNLDYTEEYYGRIHWRTASKHETVGRLYMERNELLKSRSHLKQSVEIYNETLGNDHIWTCVASLHLATTLYLMGDQQEADFLLKNNLANLKNQSGRLRSVTIHMIDRVATNLEQIEPSHFSGEIELLRGLHADL